VNSEIVYQNGLLDYYHARRISSKAIFGQDHYKKMNGESFTLSVENLHFVMTLGFQFAGMPWSGREHLKTKQRTIKPSTTDQVSTQNAKSLGTLCQSTMCLRSSSGSQYAIS
jgi:hypothetical protein